MTDSTGAPAAPPASKPLTSHRKAMTPGQRAEAIMLQKLGQMSVREIAEKVGAPFSSIRNLLTRKKIAKGSAAVVVEAKRDAIAITAMTLDPLVHAQRVFDTKNETYRITEMLRKLIASEIVKCRQENRKLGTIQNEIKTIAEAAKAIKTCREEAYAVLGIRPDDQGDEQLPDLTITDLTEDDIRDLQAMPAMEGMGDLPDVDLAGSEDDLDVSEDVD